MVYNNRHRVFLQSIMQGGAVQDEKVKSLSAKLFGANADVSSIISSINDKLAQIAMCMKSGICEITGQKYWCVVGTTHEDSVEFKSEFSKPQRAFLRAVFTEIINSDNGSISSTYCLNLANNLDLKFSKGDADVFLKKLREHEWLYYQQADGTYYMGIRSIIELMPYFRETYKEFHNCHLCKDVMFHGHRCDQCDKGFHFYCISRKLAEQDEQKCPNCFQNMNCRDIDEFNNTQHRSQTQAEEDVEIRDDEPMDVTDDVVFSQPIGVPKKSKRRTKANK